MISKKTLTTLTLAIAMSVTIVAPAFASTGDIYSLSGLTSTSKPTYTKAQVNVTPTIQKQLNVSGSSFGYEGNNGQIFKLSDVNTLYGIDGGSLTQTLADLSTKETAVATVGQTTALAVSSVSAINTTTVEVTFPALAAAQAGATVTVKNGNGTVVAVNATDIAKGATFAEFDFTTPITAADLAGVWSVNGTTYSFTAIAQLASIEKLAAVSGVSTVDDVTLSSELSAAGITSVDDSLIDTYAAAIKKASATTESLADLQTVINTANTASTTTTSDAAIAQTVVEAKTQISLYNILTANFSRVNSAWALAYASGTTTAPGIKFVAATPNANVIYTNATGTTGATKADIQTAIDAVNAAQILKADTAADTSVEQAAVTASIQSYVAADDSTTPLVTPKADEVKASEVKEDVLKVAEATTANTTYAALVNLANLDGTTLKTTDLDPTLAVQYFAEQQLAGTQTDLTTAKSITDVINDIITPAKAAAATTSLATAVAPVASGTLGTATDEAAVQTSLTAYGVKNVLPTGYLTVAAKSAIAGATDLTTLQSATDAAGLIQVKAVIAAGTAGTTADEAKAAQYLTAYGVKNVSSTGYLTVQAKSDISAAGVNSLSTLQTAVDAATLVVNQNAQLKVINGATDASTVNTALLALGDSDYLNIPSVDRLGVASAVLAALPATTGYANITALESELATATDAHTTGLNTVNALTDASTISDGVTALKSIGDVSFNNLTAAQQATIAETFENGLVFNTGAVSPAHNALKTPFKTITAIEALID